MKKILAFLLLVSITAFTACKGDMGDPGLDGTNGQNGVDGTDGQDGNANVKNHTIAISASEWVSHSNNLSYVDVQAPFITEEIASKGMVMVYFYDPAAVWFALPFTYSTPANTTQTYYFWFKTGVVRIHSLNSATPVKYSGNVRIVAVTSEGLARNPDLDWTNYEDVKKRLQLTE